MISGARCVFVVLIGIPGVVISSILFLFLVGFSLLYRSWTEIAGGNRAAKYVNGLQQFHYVPWFCC